MKMIKRKRQAESAPTTAKIIKIPRKYWIFGGLFGGEEGIRTLVGLPPNGFQDRLVMTASIPLHNERD